MDRVVAEAYQFCKHEGISLLRNFYWNRLESNALRVENISKTAFTVQKTKAEKIQNELLELYKSRTSISA